MASLQPKRQIFTVEAMRGLAALAVAWFHLTNTYSDNWVRQSGEYGWLGAEVFFVISGFIIPYSLHQSSHTLSNFTRFMLRRLVRLEPPYIVSIGIVLVLWELSAKVPGFAGQLPSYSLYQVAAHLFYLIPFTGYSWLNVVYWTLAYEFVFYILVGLSWPILAKMPISVTFFVFLFIFAFSILTGKPLPLIFLFLIGIAGVRYFLSINGLWSSVAVIIIASGILLFTAGIEVSFVGLVTIGIILFVDIPRLPMLSFLATISYSLYLIHVPVGGRVVNLGKRFGDSMPFEFILSSIALAVSIGVAVVLWKYIEFPAKQASRRVGRTVWGRSGRVADPSVQRDPALGASFEKLE